MKVGIIGFGFMGRMHYRCWQAAEQATVTAICEANPAVLASLKEPVGNVDGAAEEIDLTGVAVFDDYDRMLAEADVDAVSITLPTFLHADFTVKALERGWHVLCEKPMALTLEECDRMAAAAKDSDKTLVIGHCIRFWPEYAKVREIIASGEYGAVRAATFRRMGAAPGWGDNWFADTSKSGGMALDLHIHDADYVHYVFGMPGKVSAYGATLPGGQVGHIVAHYDYGDDKCITAEGGWIMTPSFGFEMSFDIALEKATIVLDPSRDPAFRVCPAEGEPFTPEVAGGDGYTREIAHFVSVALGDETLSVVTPEQSRETVRLVQAELASVERGEAVTLGE